MVSHPYLDESGVSIFAHRGGSIEAPENTLEAFQYALDLGCEYIETDVQLSKDGIPYIFHDDDLKRIPGVDKNFGDLWSSEISNLKIFNSYSIPTLKECLEQFPNTKFNIDLKTDAVMEPALNEMKKMNAMHRICIASFSDERLNFTRQNFPEVCLSMGPKEIWSLKKRTWGFNSKKILGNCVQVPIYKYGIKIVTKKFVTKIHQLGLKIHVWTINNDKTMQKLIDIGVDGIITDKPSVLKELLS